MKRLRKIPLWVAIISMILLVSAFSYSTISHKQSLEADRATITKLTKIAQAIFAYSAAHDYNYPTTISDPKLNIAQADLPDGFSYRVGSYKGYAYSESPMFIICATFRAQAEAQQASELPDDTGNDVFGIGAAHPKGKQCYTGTHDAKGDALRPSAQ